MKDIKIIKDLKERNDKLKMQYDFNNIHLISLENKYANLQMENTKLKQDNEEQTKTYQKILQEQQTEIDNLQRNCDVFNEQMNYAVERATELKQQLQSYKDKEDKLREYCNSCIGELNYEINDWLDDSKTENNDVIEDLEIQKQIFKDILQILNEGEKE